MTGAPSLKSLLVDGAKLSDIRLAPRTTWPRRGCEDVVFSGCDFRAVLLGGMLPRPRFHGCRYEDCDLSGLDARKTTWNRCLFSDVVFDGNHGMVKGCRFSGCEFRGVRFGGMAFEDCTFEDCRFSDTRITKVNFLKTSFDSCWFSGRFATVNWIGCSTSGVDLTQAHVSDSVLVDAPGSDILLPDNDQNYLARASDFLAAEPAIERTFSPQILASFREVAEMVKHYEFGIVLDVSDFDGIPREEALRLLSEFRRLIEAKHTRRSPS